MLATKNKYIESAYEHLQVISQDKQKRLDAEIVPTLRMLKELKKVYAKKAAAK